MENTHPHVSRSKIVHSSHRVSIMVSPPPDKADYKKKQRSQRKKKKKPHEILHRQVPAQNTTVSFQQPSLCIGKIKHLWCSHTPSPTPFVKLCYTSKWERQMTVKSTPLSRKEKAKPLRVVKSTKTKKKPDDG